MNDHPNPSISLAHPLLAGRSYCIFTLVECLQPTDRRDFLLLCMQASCFTAPELMDGCANRWIEIKRFNLSKYVLFSPPTHTQTEITTNNIPLSNCKYTKVSNHARTQAYKQNHTCNVFFLHPLFSFFSSSCHTNTRSRIQICVTNA